MDTLEFILTKYKYDKDIKSPIKMNCSRWGTMPKLFRQLGYEVGAEVGVAGGRFSKFLCEGNPKLKLYSIDAWEIYPGYKDNESQEKMERLYLEAKNRLKPFNCHIIRDWSLSAVRRFADESLDFVFIDAAHDYEHVKEDIEAWSQKVRKGGIVSGHDYIHGLHGMNYGVREAVDEWVKKNKIKYLFLLNKEMEYSCPSWMYIRQ